MKRSAHRRKFWAPAVSVAPHLRLSFLKTPVKYPDLLTRNARKRSNNEIHNSEDSERPIVERSESNISTKNEGGPCLWRANRLASTTGSEIRE
jgi:hypothetical protein